MATIARPRSTAAGRLRVLSLETRTLLLLLGPVIAFGFALVQPADYDYWWHARTGQYILQQGVFPRHDPFAFTTAGKPWVDHEWLSQVLMYGIDSTLGYLALFAACFALGLGAWWLVRRTLLREGLGDVQATLLCLAPLVVGAQHWRARPAMFTVLFVAVVLHECFAARRGERRSLWRLALLMPLWANLHGGYVIGLAIVAMFAAVQWWDRGETRGPTWRHLIAVGAAGFVLTGINPYTWHIWAYPFTYFYGENASMRLIDEWQSPDFHQLRNAPIAVMLVLAMVAGVNGRRFDAWRTLLMLALGAMALQSMRHAVLFGLAWPVIVGPALAERWEWWCREHIITRGLPSMNWALLAGTTAAMVAVLFISPRGVPLRAAPTEGALGPPAEAAAVVERDYAGARMFNEYGWGGYLIHRLYPHNQVFIDGRADLHGSLVTEYDNAIRGRGWQEMFARYGIELALLRPGVPLASQLLAAGWTVAYEDDRQVLLAAPADAAASP